MHIHHIYSSSFPAICWPVVGTLGKFPNQHLFQSKFHFSIGKLWATIKISISAWLSIKFIFSNIISIGYWQNFTFGPHFVQQFMFSVLPNGKFPLFPSLFGTLAIKAMAFHEISPFAPFCATIYILYMVKWKFLLFLILFDMLAIKAMAFCEISLSSHQNLPFLKCVKVVK